MLQQCSSLCCGRSRSARSLALRVNPVVRWGIPLTLVATDAAFIYTNLVGDATSYLDLYVLPERNLGYHTEAFVFFLSNTIQLMWENEARFLAFLIGLFSCALPHLKVVSLLAVWFAPLPGKYTSNALFVLDVISKWSFLDLFVLTMYGQALNIKVERAFFASYDVNMSLLVRPGSFVFLGAVCYALLCSQVMIALHRSTSAGGGHGSGGESLRGGDTRSRTRSAFAAGTPGKRSRASSAPSSLGARAPSASVAEAIVRAVGAPSVTARLHSASAVLGGALDPLQSAARRASASFSRAARSRASSRQSFASGERAAVNSRPVARSYQLSSGSLSIDGATAIEALDEKGEGKGSSGRRGAELSSDYSASLGVPGEERAAGGLAEHPSSCVRPWSRRVCAPLALCLEFALAPLCCVCSWWFLPVQRWLRPRKWWYFMCCSKSESSRASLPLRALLARHTSVAKRFLLHCQTIAAYECTRGLASQPARCSCVPTSRDEVVRRAAHRRCRRGAYIRSDCRLLPFCVRRRARRYTAGELQC